MTEFFFKLVLISVLAVCLAFGIDAAVHAYQAANPKPERSYYPAVDQFTDTEEKLIRWLDTDTGVICYSRSQATLSCVPLRAQRMP